MPNSLKTKLSKLRHKCQITNEEYQELIAKLDGHDEEIRADARAKTIKDLYASDKSSTLKELLNMARADARIKTIEEFAEMMRNLNTLNCFGDYVADEIDLEELMKYASEEIAEQMKGESKWKKAINT